MLKDNELARKSDGAIECRSEPLRIMWIIHDLHSADHHALDCRLSCSVRVADSPADRRMFSEVFLSARDSVTTDTLSEHFVRAIRSALSSIASTTQAADAAAGSRQDWIARIRAAADPVAFAAGLELLPPFQLEVESPSLQRHNLEQIARARAEARAAGQVQHLQRASELLKQFQEMRQAAPGVPAGKLLEQINAADRGATLQNLLLASAQQSIRKTSLYAVSGNSLVRVDLSTTPPRITPILLSTELGPFRSVQGAKIDGGSSLLIGAQKGVMLCSTEVPSRSTLFRFPDLQSPLGFNAAVIVGGEVWASHGEAGIVGWKMDGPASPIAVYPEAAVAAAIAAPPAEHAVLNSGSLRTISGSGTRTAGARNLLALDSSTLVYSLGNEVILRKDEQRSVISSPSPAEIIALIPTARSILAIHQNGTIAIIDRTTRLCTDAHHRGTGIVAATALPWLGDIRLLLASDDGPIDCIGLEDGIVTEYLSPYRGLRMISATELQIAAVAPDRQRIVIWSTSDWQRPAGELHITSHTRHRIADIEFVG